MPKRTREPSAFPRVDNHQKFSTFRLIPVINQKNYFTNYLKKDSQYMCRKIRERPENDESKVVVLQLGSKNLRIGFSSDAEPKCIPFSIAKRQPLYTPNNDETNGSETAFDDALVEVNQSFVDRMKFYKTRIISDAKDTCEQFNRRQTGEEVDHDMMNGDNESEDVAYSNTHTDPNSTTPAADGIPTSQPPKMFGMSDLSPSAVSQGYNLFWPLYRGALNENASFYRSPQEVSSDIYDILNFASTSTQHGLGIADLKESKNYDVVLVIPDLQDRRMVTQVVDALFRLGYANIALIEEAVAATYGAGISAGCVVDIGAQTTTVSCVDDGACIANSRVKLDFGGDDITRVWGELLRRISFPGNPDFATLDSLKQKFCTVNEADISVQLYKYINGRQHRKYDFKVYNEVMLPILGLFYPDLFTLSPRLSWRFSLFPRPLDPYTSHTNEPVSDADINVRLGTLAVMGQSWEENAQVIGSGADDGDASVLDVDEADAADADISREGTPANAAAASAAKTEEKQGQDEALSQLKVYDSLDVTKLALAPLDHAIIESIAQAAKQTGDQKQYYENLLVVGGGSKVPSFHVMLTDRLVMWNQSRLKEIGEVAVMAMPRDMDPETICWRGGSVYSKLKIIDEMWTTSQEWETLGSRTLHYKAALYMY